MDWFSWLSKTSLDTPTANHYALVFSNNELEADDIKHFDHEFLMSMGISIAKHRLEILKLSKKHLKSSSSSSIARLFSALQKTHKSITNYVNKLADQRDNLSSSIVVVPRRSESNSFKRAKKIVSLKKWKSLVIPDEDNNGGRSRRILKLETKKKRTPLLLPMTSHTASPVVHRSAATAAEEEEGIRWDTLFHDLKPT